jgi:hypothetical protein
MSNRARLLGIESAPTGQLEGWGQLASGVWVKASGTPSAGKAVVVNATGDGFVWGAASGGSSATSAALTAALQVDGDARVRESAGGGTINEEQVVLLAQFYGA